MYGELTDKETIARIDECLENQIHDQFEILLYKKNSEYDAYRGRSYGRFYSLNFICISLNVISFLRSVSLLIALVKWLWT
jgi:hypothetical protein